GILLLQGKFEDADELLHRAMALAHESGSKDPEVAGHRTLSELALLRGNFAGALEHTQAASGLPNEDLAGHVDDLERMSRIFAAQNDLAGARARLLEAIGIAEKIGAKGQAAQSHLGLAQLDLYEGHARASEQPIRSALETFRQEKMIDDQLQAMVTLSRCLLMQGKVKDAEAALGEGNNAVAHGQNPTVQLTFAIADARVKAAGTSAAHTLARTELQRSIKEAGNLGMVPLQFEAQLALDELELSENPAAGKKSLGSLEKRAHERGLELIARRAAAAR